ncbi:hypothetical protein [Streptomyces sp. NPDC050416]|uniref:hypothetical protein n=1 Tax=Streptomyces sp. NPDC050416 TaxID=3365611 RepID=UPI0037ADE9EE
MEYELDRAAAVEVLREETRQVLRGPRPVAHISEREAAVATLAAAAELLPEEDVDAHVQRVRGLEERAVASVPGLGEIVREIGTALATATATAPP